MISGIVLTGGLIPAQDFINQAKEAGIPVLLARADTYLVASTIHDLNVKIRPSDREKIEIVKGLIHNYVDLEMLLKRM
jgi:BioD-like phosphotransacetylase family protein